MDIRLCSEVSGNSSVSFADRLVAGIWSSLARILPIVALVGACCGLANAQSLGYVVNSTSGTVTVFANAASALSAKSFSEDTLQTVSFPTQSGQSAPSLVAAAVAPAEGTNTPKSRFVYVTDQANNQLWSFDVSTISQANAVAKPVSIAAGSCSGTLFNQPSQIVIATPGSSALAYVANKGNGTVTVVNVAASTPSCVAIISNASLGAGTITALGTSAASDMTDVFVLTTTPAIATINTGTQTATKLTLNPDQNQPPDPFSLSSPASISVQDDGAHCYYFAVGDKGNGKISLAAAADAAGACSALQSGGLTVGQATLIQPITLGVFAPPPKTPNPVSLVSTVSSATNSGSIYVADAANDDLWGIDCSVSSGGCVVSTGSAITDSSENPVTPSGLAITVLQTSGETVNQYVYVTGTSTAGAFFEYSDVGASEGEVDSLNISSLTPGSGPQSLSFSAVDPNDPPVAWLTPNSSASPQGPVWVVRPNSGLTVLGASILPLTEAHTGLTLNLGLANFKCANFENPSNPAGTCTSTDAATAGEITGGSGNNNTNDNLPGTNGLGGNGSNSSDGNANNLNLSASTVFTVTLASCYNPSTSGGITCPTSSTADTQVAQQVFAGIVCTSFQIGPSASLALKQAVTATAICYSPANANGPNGFDGFTATVNWGDGSMPQNSTTTPVTCPGTGCATQTVSPIGSGAGNYQYEIATLTFMYANGYSTTGMHPIMATVQDTSESNITGYFTTSSSTTATQIVTVNALSLAISPTGSSSSPLQVKISTTSQVSTQPFAGTVSFATSTPTVTAALTASGTACSPGCGTISTVTVTPVSGTTTYNISATYTAPATLFTGTITLTFNANSGAATAQAFIATTTGSSSAPPSCSFSSPPTNGQTALALSVALACTAPAGDALTATVNWSDGSPSTVTGTATGGSVTLTFTHTYANIGSYAVSVTSITDTTTGFSGTPPSAIAIKIYLTPTVTPTQAALATIGLGQSASFSVNIAGGTTDANVTFSSFACSGLPMGATCTFSPSSITLDANGNSTAPLVVTITLAGATTALLRPEPANSRPPLTLLVSIWGLPGLGLILLAASDSRRDRRKGERRHIWVALLLVLVILWMPACSSVQQSNVTCTTCAQSGTYPITITAKSINPALQATTVFTLTVAQ